jgi:hypothetical protein
MHVFNLHRQPDGNLVPRRSLSVGMKLAGSDGSLRLTPPRLS